MRFSIGDKIDKHPYVVALIVIVLLTALAYGATVRNGFVWDDETFIVNNPYIHDLSLWPWYFTDSKSVSNVPVLSNMYRPLQTLSFAFDAALWKSWTGGFHLTSLLLHIAASLAIIFAFGALLGNRAAVAAAVVFSIHPALSEGVLSLAARGNQLYTIFALISIGCFVRISRPFDRNHTVSILAAILSFLSKEPAIVLVVLLPLIQALFERPWNLRTRQSLPLFAPYVGAAALYLVLRASVIDATWTIPAWGGGPWRTVLMQAKVFIIYLRLSVWPFLLYGRYPVPYSDPYLYAYLLANIALLASVFPAFRRGAEGRLYVFAVAWFYLSLAPVSNIIPLPGNMMGERFIYFTFAGFFPVIASLVERTMPRRAFLSAGYLGLILLIAFLAMDVQRTGDWKDNASFFSSLARNNEPYDPVIEVHMAKEELASGNAAGAVSRLERTVKTMSTFTLKERAPALYWYGRALLGAGRPLAAYEQFKTVALLEGGVSMELLPFIVEAAALSGDTAAAQSLLRKSLRSSPRDDNLWNSLGNVLFMSGDRKGARAAYGKALEINPMNREAAQNLLNAGSQSSH